MFDDVPVRVWLIIGIAFVAYPQVQYVARHVANSPSRQDITQPRPDLSWRTSAQLVRSLIMLGLLVALVVFIFTPAAESFAQSPRFWPILVLGFGVWALSTVALGLVSGRIEPLIRGFSNTYERGVHPKRFWASLTWNAALGSLMLWLAYQPQEEASVTAGWDRCFDSQTGVRDVNYSACMGLLAKYEQSVRRDPQDYASRYNRGLVFRQLGNDRRAMEDFSAVIRLKPDDRDAYFERGLLHLDAHAAMTRPSAISPRHTNWTPRIRGRSPTGVSPMPGSKT